MSIKSIVKRMGQSLQDMCYVWKQELKMTLRDEGVLLFVIIVPLTYPLLYSWIYNNEVVREVPVAVVDESHSATSREFARHCDASPDVRVAAYAANMEEAKTLMRNRDVSGIYHLPADFATRLNQGQQAVVGVYCDMSIMLNYKAIYQTASAVSLDMNAHIQTKLAGNHTDREDEITTQPLDFDEVPVFNPAGGYGSFILPAVLVLIIQQTLLLGIGLSAGTARENNRYKDLVPISRHYQGIFRIVFGKSMCYFMIYAIMASYLTLIVPRLFSFVTIGQPVPLFAVMVPYLLACIFFGLCLSCMIRYRENVMLLVVFSSVPLLFLSGVSWPQSNMPGIWQTVACLFPSTFGIRAYVRINSMGATLQDVATEYNALWTQAAAYFLLACAVYRNQILRARQHALERLGYMKRKREVRRRLKERNAASQSNNKG